MQQENGSERSNWANTRTAVLALAAILLASTPAIAQKVSKVGVLATLTGGAAADGQETVRGVQLAVDEANAKGGIAGYKFEVVPADIKEQSSEAVTGAVERLAADPTVNLIVTGYASTSNFEIDLMAEHKMPYLLAGNSAQTRDIIGKNPDKYPTVWSLTPSFDAYETELVPVLLGLEKAGKIKFPNKKVALISSDNPYSKTIYMGLKKSFQAAGWQIVVDELVPFGEINDWRALLAKVRRDPPAVLINTDYLPANAATFMSQFMEGPTKSLVFIQYAPSVPEFVKLTKEKSTGVLYNLLGGPLDSPKNPRAGEVAKKFKDKFGIESGPYGIGLYEMMGLYFDALAKVGEPAKHIEIGKALGETDKAIAEGRVKFDPKTHLSLQGSDYIPITFYQIWEGNRVLFYPEKYATGEFKLPPWMK